MILKTVLFSLLKRAESNPPASGLFVALHLIRMRKGPAIEISHHQSMRIAVSILVLFIQGQCHLGRRNIIDSVLHSLRQAFQNHIARFETVLRIPHDAEQIRRLLFSVSTADHHAYLGYGLVFPDAEPLSNRRPYRKSPKVLHIRFLPAASVRILIPLRLNMFPLQINCPYMSI